MKKYLVLVIVLGALIVGALTFGALYFPKTWAYGVAVEQVTHDEKIVDIFGGSINIGFIYSWRIGFPWRYRFSIPIYGNEKSGVIRVTAKKIEDGWKIEHLEVYSSGQFIKSYKEYW